MNPLCRNYSPTNKSDTDKQLQNVPILVVEDNPFNILVAQSLLERSGAIVEVANNGEEALEKIQPGKYRLVLMDLNMPVMDGFEATCQIRARGVTAAGYCTYSQLTAPRWKKDVQSAGLTDIVVKPFNPDELFRVLLKLPEELTTPVYSSGLKVQLEINVDLFFILCWLTPGASLCGRPGHDVFKYEEGVYFCTINYLL